MVKSKQVSTSGGTSHSPMGQSLVGHETLDHPHGVPHKRERGREGGREGKREKGEEGEKGFKVPSM